MLWIGSKKVGKLYIGRKLVSTLYVGAVKAYTAIASCFGSGWWRDQLPWRDNDPWKD